MNTNFEKEIDVLFSRYENISGNEDYEGVSSTVDCPSPSPSRFPSLDCTEPSYD